ncbi:helix-turn-helix domain-containing protein, partial [Thermogemmatispora sp.]
EGYAVPEGVRGREALGHPARHSTKKGQIMEELLTISEVARVLRVDATTVRRWVKHGVLDAVLLPHKGRRHCYRIKRTTLNKVMNSTNV